MKRFKLEITESELSLLLAGLESYAYWDLDDAEHIPDPVPVSDVDVKKQIKQCRALVARLDLLSLAKKPKRKK